MKTHLYFICPTDHLESVINNRFREQNYFCTSLGNSILFDSDQMGQISMLIEDKGIIETTFILSDSNPLIIDAIKNERFSNLTSLKYFHDQVSGQKFKSNLIWNSNNLRFPVISYHLTKKAAEFRSKLSGSLVDRIKVNVKLYKTQRDVFSNINMDLIPKEAFSLN